MELKKCPFCGEKPELHEHITRFRNMKSENGVEVECLICFASQFGKTKEEAISAWNRRADGWVSDRLPNENDANTKGEVIVLENGYPETEHFYSVLSGQFWISMPPEK